jgi:signal transduction histidine kinase
MFFSKKIIGKRIGLLLLMALFLGSCKKNHDTEIIYKEPAPEILDATCNWLNKDENFNKTTYLTTFYTYYNKKINEKNFNDAATALEIFSSKSDFFGWFDQSFFQTIKSFSNKYRNQISAVKASFIDKYLGDYYSDQGNYKKAISYYIKSTSFDVVDYITCRKKASGFLYIAWAYNCLGKQNLAFNYNLQALKYYKKLDDKSKLGGVYVNFSEIYKTIKDYKKSAKSIDSAIYYYSYDIKRQQENIFACLINKIDLYDKINDTIKKNQLIDSVFIVSYKYKTISTLAKTPFYTYKVYSLLDKNKITDAKKLLDELKPTIIKSNSVICKQLYDLCLTSYEIKKNNGFIDTTKITKAIPVLLENENYARALDFYYVLYKNAIAKKDFKNALNYSQKIAISKDSMQSKKMANKVAELNQKYQTKKKEQQIILQKETILNNKTTIALLGVTSICLFLLVFAISIINKQRKSKLDKQNIQLYTKQLLEKTEEERKRIASDLHDSVSHELLGLKNIADGKQTETNQKIDNIINDIRSISRNLHPIMFDIIGLKASVEQLTERAQSVNDFMVTSEINYEGSMATEKELQVYRIIQEAVSNVIKYAEAMAAKITISEKDNTIDIEIKDNGKGFNVKEVLNGSKSFGLHNIIERSKAIGGKAKITSNKNGTSILIQIKKVL